MTTAPHSASWAATLDLPVPMPPPKPMTSMIPSGGHVYPAAGEALDGGVPQGLLAVDLQAPAASFQGLVVKLAGYVVLFPQGLDGAFQIGQGVEFQGEDQQAPPALPIDPL